MIFISRETRVSLALIDPKECHSFTYGFLNDLNYNMKNVFTQMVKDNEFFGEG